MKTRKRRFIASVESMEERFLLSTVPQFSIKDVGLVANISRNLWDGSGGSIRGINNSGQIVGTDILNRAVLSGPDGGPFAPIFETGESHGFAVNDSGQVTGYKVNSSPYSWQAFLKSNNTLTYYNVDTVANGINNLGDSVGRNTLQALLFHDGASVLLGTLGGDNSEAFGINDSTEVTGMSYTFYRRGHAFYWNGSMNDLGTLGGDYSFGYGINSSGQVVGESTIANNNLIHHAFVSDPHGGSLHDLGSLPAFPMSIAYSVNDTGEIVGTSCNAFTATIYTPIVKHAFVDIDNAMYDLNNLIPTNSGFTLLAAMGVNNNGQIAVEATDSSGQTHALLLTPVPSVPVAPTITWANPSDITYGTPLSATQLNATASVPGTFTYNVAEGTVLHAGAAQTLTATFTPDDTTDYTTVTATASINVLKAPLTVTANNAQVRYPFAIPPLTGTITGLVNGDTDVATYTTTAVQGSWAGYYPIVPHLTDPNYNITFVNGTLTIYWNVPPGGF